MLSLLLLWRDRLLAALLAVHVWLRARLTRNTWNGLTRCTQSRGGGLLGRSRRGKSRIAWRGEFRLLRLSLPLGGELVLKVLDVVVCIVLNRGLGRFMPSGSLLRWGLFAGPAEYRCQND